MGGVADVASEGKSLGWVMDEQRVGGESEDEGGHHSKGEETLGRGGTSESTHGGRVSPEETVETS